MFGPDVREGRAPPSPPPVYAYAPASLDDDRTPADAVINDTEETDLAKLGVSTSGLALPDDLKNAPLSIISPSEIQVQVLHSLSGASSRFVT